jgi:predicted secreted acid phosphatase
MTMIRRALAILLVSAAVSQGAAAQSRLPNLGELKLRLLEYKRSGAYERDVAAVLSRAQRYIEKRASRVRQPAIVLDIDETSLLSWVEMLANDFGYIPAGPCDDLPAGPCGVRAWELSARAEVIAPTLALYQAARAKGVTVFFLSGRPEIERAATEKNLRAAGYVDFAGVLLRPTGNSESAAVFKSGERKKIAAQGYAIIANIGDQPSDLAGGYAEKAFLVPNPFYRIR